MRTRSIDGLLLVDKPAGVTSHDVVAIARRTLGVKRMGHAGTLDPFATGLLVLLAGRATRLLAYLDGEPKVYEASIRFGSETRTDDMTGEEIHAAPLPSAESVDHAIGQLTGSLQQLPPAYSAKQVGGQRAYDAARAGAPLELKPVPVTVHEWTVTNRTADTWSVTITCGGGTYVRALARDVGRLSGSRAHLSALRRIASGPFHVADAHTLDALSSDHVHPMRDAVRSLPGQTLLPEAIERVLHGRTVPALTSGSRSALLDEAGDLLAVAERVGEEWQPKVVLRDR